MIRQYEFLLIKNICTLFGLGNISKMPGTLGSIAGLIVGLIVLSFSYNLFIIFFIIIFFISFYVVKKYQTVEGVSDKSEIIIDEFIGQQIPLAFIDLNFLEIFLTFILFRLFDIYKVYPTNIIDKKYVNHFGVIFDDILAGIQATFILLLFSFI